MELATYQPRGLPMGFDYSPKPLTVDFVKLCGLDMNINIIILFTPSLPLWKTTFEEIKLWTLSFKPLTLSFELYSKYLIAYKTNLYTIKSVYL